MLDTLSSLMAAANDIAGCVHGVVGPAAAEGRELAGEARERCAETLTGGDDERAVRSALRHLADAVDVAADRLENHAGGVALTREQNDARNTLLAALKEAHEAQARVGDR